MPVTGDQQLLKQLNRMALVRQVSAQPGLSRAALADVLGLTKSTVSLLVRELVDEGWLAESELRTTGEVGRRATPLHLDPARLALLGADVGVDEARVVATDLLGRVVAALTIQYDDVADAASCIGLVAQGLTTLARRLARSRAPGGPRHVLGMGIGLHGAVDEAAGLLRHAPHLGWRNVDVGALLAGRFGPGTPLAGVPLYMQNEANVAALGEFEFTPQSATDPLIYLSIGYGVGAGVIVSDRLLTGRHGYAGEVGHAILQVDGPLCSCGRRGCADALLGLGALLGGNPQHGTARASPGLANPGRANPGRASPGRASPPSLAALQALFDRVGHGEGTACAAVTAAGRQLGVLLNNLWASFDPMAIVIGGAALGLGDTLVGPARTVLAGYAEAAMMAAPAIRLSHFGADAVAVGGAALARYRLTRPLDG